ncbi:proteasome subunit beta [Haloarchaeobius salinus]|uniref:proteasome subunit beta n=1 Tax=Haloarchaeobius salinus TaxID=1198298 RepID=UPI002108D76A|nr:proteasome subunit beta [Haloarchaeobius salinus]
MPDPGIRTDRRTEFEVSHTGTDAPALETGTTIVALTAPDAVVVAADRRASLGGQFVANKDVTKVERITDRAALALSGSVGPLQSFADTLRAEANLYEARRGDRLSTEALANVAGNLVRGIPAQVVLAGVDEDGPAVYELDGGGSVMETDYAAGGSGMQVAYGTLEGKAEQVESIEDARELAADAVAAASERDTASGNGVTVATITSEGVELDEAAEPGEVV